MIIFKIIGIGVLVTIILFDYCAIVVSDKYWLYIFIMLRYCYEKDS